jgi:integration host factor subunit alpha
MAIACMGMPKFPSLFDSNLAAGRRLPSLIQMAVHFRMIYMSIDRVFPNTEPLIIEKRRPSPRGAVVPNKTVTRADLAGALSHRFGLLLRDSRQIVESVLEEIAEALVRGENIKLSGFGSINQRAKSARPGRNPRNGVDATISSRRVLLFKPSRQLREVVRDGGDA